MRIPSDCAQRDAHIVARAHEKSHFATRGPVAQFYIVAAR